MKHFPLISLSLLALATAFSILPSGPDPQLFLPEDLEAKVWAESPQFFNPTNMDVDARGRVWVTEAVNYRNFNNDTTKFVHFPKGDRVVILEDTDEDGRADKNTVFVQDTDLVSPLGIAVLGHQVVVSCSPNLLIYTDDDGDDRADRKEILLAGFGGKDHDHALHATVVGPDGKWYFNTGNAGPHHVRDKNGWTLRSGSVYTGGSPWNESNEGNQRSDDGKVWVGGLALRCNPDGTGLEVLAHGFRNAYEYCVDSYGDFWQSDNDDQVEACRNSWLAEGGNAGFFSADGTRTWLADQRPGQTQVTAQWHSEDPGAMPPGDVYGAGSPTGVCLNEGDALGAAYRGLFLAADAGRNCVFSYQPALSGAGFQLEGLRNFFVASVPQDNPNYVWYEPNALTKEQLRFRPSDVCIGTDGALYVADWYDPVVGGHLMFDSKGYGRIFRIAPKNKPLKKPRLDFVSLEGQLDALKNPAVHARSRAFAALQARGEAAVGPVKKLLQDENPYVQARALWLLSKLGEKGRLEVEKSLGNPDPRLRSTALRALRQMLPPAALRPVFEKMADDASLFVRREILCAVRDWPLEQSKQILLRALGGFDGEDLWFLNAFGAALDAPGKAEAFFPLLQEKFAAPLNGPAQYDPVFARLCWRLHAPQSVVYLKKWALSPDLSETERRRAVVALGFVPTKQAASAMLELARETGTLAQTEAKYWLEFRRDNDWAGFLSARELETVLVRASQPAFYLQKRAQLLDEKMDLAQKRAIAEELARDSIGGTVLMGLVSEKRLPKDLAESVAAVIFQNPNPQVRTLAENFFQKPQTASPYDLPAIAARTGKVAAGRKIFEKNCATCHRFGQMGMEIGPNLTSIGQKYDPLALLEAIVNPNAALVFGYEPWLLTTKSGETHYGFLVAENSETLTVKDLSGNLIKISVSLLVSKQKQKNLMPDAATLGLEAGQLADLLGFLRQ